MTPRPPQPLAGKRVVEFSQFIAGPTAAQMLADFGAEIITVEPPLGDGSRALPGGDHGFKSQPEHLKAILNELVRASNMQ